MWKILNIKTGKTIKKGFEDEESAKEWIEEYKEGRTDIYQATEMDEDEIEEWKEFQENDTYNEEDTSDMDEEIDVQRYTYKIEDDNENEEDEMIGDIYEVDIDEEDDKYKNGFY